MNIKRQQIRHAARVLDGIKPRWVDHVNIKTLDMRFTDRCVLVQVFHQEGSWQHVSGYRFARRVYQFDIPKSAVHSYLRGYDKMQAMWIEEIQARQKYDAIKHANQIIDEAFARVEKEFS